MPASPFDGSERKDAYLLANKASRSSSNLRFWAEADNESHRESDTECTELDTEHKDTDDESEFFLISGLYYIDDYITNEQHDTLVQYFNNNEWEKRDCRIIQEYIYSLQDGDDDNGDYLERIHKKPFDEMPFCVESGLSELVNNKEYGLPNDYYFDQLIVNNYPSFGGIEYHQDSMHCFDEYIICVSLLSEAVMNFKNIETNEIRQILLKPKSLLILSGDARYKWQRGIIQKDVHIYNGKKINRNNRMSLTFRKCINLDEFQENDKDENKESQVSINNNINNDNQNQFLSKIDSILNIMDNFME